MNTSAKAIPTIQKDRIDSIDFLRGFAILGILIMNIQSFSMPGAAYTNPMAYGNMTGVDKWVWMISHIFADQKFMTIFSILYGAGILLVTQNAEIKTGKSAGLHYSRTFWLLVFGLIHAHLIWYGDILFTYAISALLAYLFRKLKPKKLLIIGLCVIAIHSILYLFVGLTLNMMPAEDLDGLSKDWLPTAEMVSTEITAITGTLSQQVSHISTTATMMETLVFFLVFLWRAGGLMLVGMALFKWGILSAQKSISFYQKGWLFSWLIGIPITSFGIYQNYQWEWSLEAMFIGSQFNYWGSLAISFGFICMIMLVAKSDKCQWIKERLSAIGQMALTNYLMQSLICTFIFFGIGLGYFGQFSRWQQIIVVLGLWILQYFWSKPWLEKFKYGPFEWLWRSLTYIKIQPFRK